MKPDEIIEAYEAWWDHRNDEPVIAFSYDKPEVDVRAREGTDDLRYIDEAIDNLERSIDEQDFLGAGVPSRPFMLGPGSILDILAALRSTGELLFARLPAEAFLKAASGGR